MKHPISFTYTTGKTLTAEFRDSTGIVEDVGDGWYRISLSGLPRTTASGGTTPRFYIYPDVAGSVNLGDDVYVWHPQVNRGDATKGYHGT